MFLQVDRRELQFVCSLHRSQRDREILNCKSPRVEDGDVFLRLATLGCSREDVAKLGHIVTTEDAGFDGVNEIAVMRGLLPVVAEDVPVTWWRA
jgi:hypothetical protein